MREIKLDATNWASILDFCYALFPALGAPDWHGLSVDALIDSMIWGGINAVAPPYVVKVYHTVALPSQVLRQLILVRDCLAEARDEFRVQEGYDVDVSLEITS